MKPKTPEPIGEGARAASKLAMALLGSLHSIVALWLTGRTGPRPVAAITGLPIRTVSAAARGLIDYKILSNNGPTWQHVRPTKPPERVALYKILVTDPLSEPVKMAKHQTARQIFKARKRSSAQ